MKIAVCITSRNRHEVLELSMAHHNKYMPPNSKLFIVDDASQPPVWGADYRFEKRAGVPRSKNMCLELAYNWGADHIFLFDDDCYPIANDWWKPYVDSSEPHLMYQFNLPNKPVKDMMELKRLYNLVSYTHTRGAMIYVERRVLDAVGGFDTNYGLGYFEHPDFTNRIHNAGLTTERAMDVENSKELLYCLDQDSKVNSTLGRDPALWQKNHRYYNSQRESKEYKEFTA